ncbi:MAG: hypothetical protein LLG97_06815 [Deltaproteobacteria bacterium]|nr:hypothetical protein [Deltaproteobacteria bacterium]
MVIIWLVSATLFLPAPGRASLTSADWRPASEDGWITQESESGLDWLDVTLTTNQTFDQVRTGIWYERGFRHATVDELRTLFIHAGTPDDGFDTAVTHRVETQTLISLVGATPDGGSNTMGLTGSDFWGHDITTANYPIGVRFSALLGKLQVGPSWGEASFSGGHPFSDEASPSWGSFLVRTTPPPPAVSNVSPFHKATGVPLSPRLQIEASSANGSGKTHRSTDWEVSSDVAFSADTVVFKSLSDRRNLTAIIVPPGCLKPDTTYYWRARMRDTAGQSSGSDLSLTTSFRTLAVALDAGGVVVEGIAVKRLGVQVVNLNGLTDAELKEIGAVSSRLVAAFPVVNAGLTADITQAGMMIARANDGDGTVIGLVTPAGVRIASFSTMTVSDPGFDHTPLPPKTNFPHGIVGFRLAGVAPGGSMDVRLYLPEDLPPDAAWYKYHPARGWMKVNAVGTHDTDGTLLSAATRFVVNDGIGILTVTDDDPLIDFSTEISGGTGVIVDPGGIGIPVAAGDSGGCFIATAAYGSALEPRVATLRAFRDRYLLHRPWGRAFVRFYYAYSPAVADSIAGHGSLRAAVRLVLLPFIGFSSLALMIGFLPAFAGLAIIPGLGIIGWRMIRNRGAGGGEK